MATRVQISALFCVVVVLFGFVAGVDISFEDPHYGFFIKSAYHRFQPSSPREEKEAFILTHPAELYKLRAKHGPFEVYQSVPSSFVEHAIPWVHSSHRFILYNMDISAHVVGGDLSPNQTLLQVLIHAQPLLDRKKAEGVYFYGDAPQRWCGQLFVEHRAQRLSAVCVLGEKHNACVAGVHLPAEWWHHNDSHVSVYYDIAHVEENQECASASNSIVPARSITNSSSDQKRLLATLPLRVPERKEMELEHDHLILQVPTESFYPGARFDVPVLLESGPEVFKLKAKVRNGLRILGATADPDSPWSIYLEMKDRKRLAAVSAMLQRRANDIKPTKRQEVFVWKFEVDDTITEPLSVGRITWSVDYEKPGFSQKPYLHQDDKRKLVTHVTITTHHQQRLVPVFKEGEVLNTAVLTGHRQAFPLLVYATQEDGSLQDVTAQAACQALDPDVLKVAADCSEIFLDGTETSGSLNATVEMRLGEMAASVVLRVWLPDERLDLQLSDTRLSAIRGWRVPHPQHPGEKEHHGCQLRFQQSMVDVYTRFLIRSPGQGTEYYRSRKVYLRVTDLVLHRLKVADPSVAALQGKLLHGRAAGRTQLQVLSGKGRVLASKEVKVGKDKVNVERLLVRMVSHLSLQVRQAEALPGALTAVAHLQEKLAVPSQEGVLDIAIQYSDGTSFPLKHIYPSDYDLRLSSMNHHVVEVPEPRSPGEDRVVRAVGEASGELVKAVFRISSACPRKRTRPLATSFVYVNIDFSKASSYQDLARVQSDANYDNHASDRWEAEQQGRGEGEAKGPGSHLQNKNAYLKHQHQTGGGGHQPAKPLPGSSDPQVIPIDRALEELANVGHGESASHQSPPRTEAQQLPLHKPGQLSPLEIGMYVLLAVFCVAILVFTVNCVVFMVRYRRKRIPKDRRDPVLQANDWVWIGRATLERNGTVHTRCSQTLMPEEDFNGNQMLVRTNSGSTGSRARSGSASGSGGGSSGGSAPNSNRNSTVSTYKGSECSIRITANPLPDGEQLPGTHHRDPEWDYEAMGLTYDQLMDYFDNLKESTA